MTVVRRKCACTNYLEADPADPDDVVAAVVRDQETAAHRDWFAAQQILDEKVSLPVRLGPKATLRQVA